MKNRSLKALSLLYNEVGDEGAVSFMDVIKENDVISKIDFDDKTVSEKWKHEVKEKKFFLILLFQSSNQD